MRANAGLPERWWHAHLRGHFLRFEARPTPSAAASAGVRLLLVAVLLEAARLAAVTWMPASVPLWLLLPGLLGLGLAAVPVAGITLPQLGFRRWRHWTLTEKSYVLQVVVLANIVFPLVLAGPLRARSSELGTAWSLSNVFVPYLFFGFYQELVYRGMVQSALVSRWRAPIAIVIANVFYTIGPLHWNYFAAPASLAMPMFAAIFAIGLFFGALYQRSGNLWIPAIFHAIGNAYILWSVGPVRHA